MSQSRLIHGFLAVTTLGVMASFSAVAQAHFNLTMPPAADTDTAGGVLGGGKGPPPCGPTSQSGIITAVQGGHPLAIQLTETVYHPGFYRFALSINSRDELPPDPATDVNDGGLSISAAIENPAVFPVIADGVFVHDTRPADLTVPYTTTIMLPNITCAKCTLQVVEFMAEHRSNTGPDGGVAGGFFYHHCADLKITADDTLPSGTADGGAPDADSSGAGGGALGGQSAAGGSTGSGGNTGSGGTGGTGGTGGSSNSDAGTQPPASSSSSGCSIGGPLVLAPGAAAFLLFGLVLVQRRRRRS
jgi:hypothetical protein